MWWGAVAKEKTAAEQRQGDRPQDGGTLLAAAVQEEERQNNDEEQDQTALQHAHRAGFGFDRPFVEELMAQGQGDKETQKQGCQGQAGNLGESGRIGDESVSHSYKRI